MAVKFQGARKGLLMKLVMSPWGRALLVTLVGAELDGRAREVGAAGPPRVAGAAANAVHDGRAVGDDDARVRDAHDRVARDPAAGAGRAGGSSGRCKDIRTR